MLFTAASAPHPRPSTNATRALPSSTPMTVTAHPAILQQAAKVTPITQEGAVMAILDQVEMEE